VGQNKLSVLPRKWRMKGEGHLTGAEGEKKCVQGFGGENSGKDSTW
jgi:hypothetical protein